MKQDLRCIHTPISVAPWLLVRKDTDILVDARCGANKFEIIVEAKNLKNFHTEKVSVKGIHP